MSSPNASDSHEVNAPDCCEHMPVAKKLKSSPTDLVIQIGKDKVEYHCHSMIMASRSEYIDGLLASGMLESQTRIIHLSDVSTEVWRKMMKLNESTPTYADLPKMELSEIVPAAEKFDEYHFHESFDMCKAEIARRYKDVREWMDGSSPLGIGSAMDSLITCALWCNQIPRLKSMSSILEFFRRALTLPQEAGNHYGGLVFKHEQLKELAPFIAEHDLLGDSWTKEEIQNPLFPKLFLMNLQLEYEEKRFGPVQKRSAPRLFNLKITGKNGACYTIGAIVLQTGPENPSPYAGTIVCTHRNATGLLRDELQNARVVLRKSTSLAGMWQIAVERRTEDDNEAPPNNMRILWYSPLSFNCINFPPMKPWVKVDDDAPAGCLEVVPDFGFDSGFGNP